MRSRQARRRATTVEQLGVGPVGRLLWVASSQTTLSVGVYGVHALTNAWFVARGAAPTAMAAVNLVARILLGLGAVSTSRSRSIPCSSSGSTPASVGPRWARLAVRRSPPS